MYRPVSAAAGKNIVFGLKNNFLSWTPQFGKSGMLGYDENIVVYLLQDKQQIFVWCLFDKFLPIFPKFLVEGNLCLNRVVLKVITSVYFGVKGLYFTIGVILTYLKYISLHYILVDESKNEPKLFRIIFSTM